MLKEMLDADSIIKRYKQAQERKANWENTYKEALSYAAPQREDFDYREKGSRKDNTDIVFDSTAQSALNKFASNMQSSLVPPMKKWINLASGYMVPEEDRSDNDKQLEKIRDAMFSAIQSSNFDTQISEAFLGLGLGNGVMLVQPGEDSLLKFTAIPESQCYFEEGPNGSVGTVFRRHCLAGRNIEGTWPDAALSKELSSQIDSKPEKELDFIEVTLKCKINKKFVEGDDVILREIDGYKYFVIHEKSKEIIVEREQESSPWVVFRWSVMPGEVYGRGPVLSALADIKTLNKTKELILQNASMAVAGAWTVADDGVMSLENIQIAPGALIPVSSNPGAVNGPTIAPLRSGADFSVAQLVIQELQRSINDMMFADPLGPIDLPVKTATEISVRQNELSKRIGSAFGRLQYELIGPLVDRILYLLEEAGVVDLSGFKVDGNTISIEHISPLAMAQDQEELMAMMRYAETIAQNLGPQAVSTMIKPEQFAKKLAQLLNVPKDIVPTDAEFKQMKEAAGVAAVQNHQAGVGG